MKRLLISVFAVAAALFATSCAQDGIDNSAAKGEEAVVTFAVNAPEMATRALFGDGTAANQLYYAVYDEDNKVIDAISVIDNPEAINISTQVKLRLVNGNTYSLIFWAQNADGVATIDWDAQTMTYDPTAMSVEAYDAFWAYVEPFTVNGAMQKNVDLYRPFAQVIIGAADYDDAVAAGLTVAETQITVTTPSAMNLVDGAASVPAEFTYAYAALPTEAFPVADHQHMGMTYLLFGADKGMVDIKFDYKDAANNEYTRNFPAVPVQRNFRTVIYGNLLTSQTDFNVKIVPGMQDIDWPLSPEYTAVTTLAELQAALDAAKAGEKTSIVFGANIEGDVTITEKADATILIDGADYEYDGTMTFIGGSTYANATTQITNLNFVANEAKTFIYGDASNGNARYVDNVTILDCTFTANVAAGVDVVGAKLRSLKGEFNLINCEANGLHTLVQTNSCGEGVVLVDNCVINGKNGVSFTNGTKSAKVSNSTIVADGYGVRSDARTANEALNVENCDITAELPIVVRDLSKNDGFTLTFAGANNFVGGAGYDAVLTDGDDGTFIIPTKSYTLVGAEGYKVFPDAVIVNHDAALTAAQNGKALSDAIKAAKDGATVYVGAGTYDMATVSAIGDINNKSVTLQGVDGTIITGSANASYGLRISASEEGHVVNIHDITFGASTRSNVYAKGWATVNLYDCVVSTLNMDSASTLVNGVEANGCTATISAYNCAAPAGEKINVEFIAKPCTSIGTMDEVTYTQFNYDDATAAHIGVCGPNAAAISTGANMFVNGEAVAVAANNVVNAVAMVNALADPNVTYVKVNAPIAAPGEAFEVAGGDTKKIDFNGNEFNAGSTSSSMNYALEVAGEAEVDNANFTRAGVAALDGGSVVFNSGTINHKPDRTGRYIFCAIGEGSTITIKDGTFKNDRSKNKYFGAWNGGTIIVEGGNFGGVASNDKVYTANGGKVIIKGGTFNFDPTAWLAEGYEAVNSGSTWTVQAE